MKINDLPSGQVIEKTANALKKIPEMQPPEWSQFVKTGVHKERPPVDENWWYVRSASILKKISRLGPIGVNKLRKKYGGKKNRGHKPEKRFDASGNIIRKILQQLEKANFIEQTSKGVHKGRILTPKGKSFLDKSSK
jgi:small subunit ribosomal protein S19e